MTKNCVEGYGMWMNFLFYLGLVMISVNFQLDKNLESSGKTVSGCACEGV